MTLNLNEHKWLKPALFGALLVGAVLAWLHLAGAVVLAGIGRDYNAATPMTYIQYAAHFGGHKRIGMWLWVGAAVSTVALLAPLFLFMRPSKRSRTFTNWNVFVLTSTRWIQAKRKTGRWPL